MTQFLCGLCVQEQHRCDGGVWVVLMQRGQGCIRREGPSEGAPVAVR